MSNPKGRLAPIASVLAFALAFLSIFIWKAPASSDAIGLASDEVPGAPISDQTGLLEGLEVSRETGIFLSAPGSQSLPVKTVDEDGNPLHGSSVHVHLGTGEAIQLTTGADGTTSVSCPNPSSGFIYAVYHRPGGQALRSEVKELRWDSPGGITLQITRESAILMGIVRRGGLPVADLRVGFMDLFSFVQTTTDEQGLFQFEDVAPNVSMRFECYWERHTPFSTYLELSPAEVRVLDVELGTGSLIVSVDGVDDLEAESGLTVRLESCDGWPRGVEMKKPVHSGSAVFDLVPPGRYYVRLTKSRRHMGSFPYAEEVRTVQLEQGAVRVEFQLRQAPRVEVVVETVTPSGMLTADCWFEFEDGATTLDAAASHGKVFSPGVPTLIHAPIGASTLVISSRDYGLGRKRLFLSEKEEQRVTVQLSRELGPYLRVRALPPEMEQGGELIVERMDGQVVRLGKVNYGIGRDLGVPGFSFPEVANAAIVLREPGVVIGTLPAGTYRIKSCAFQAPITHSAPFLLEQDTDLDLRTVTPRVMGSESLPQ